MNITLTHYLNRLRAALALLAGLSAAVLAAAGHGQVQQEVAQEVIEDEGVLQPATQQPLEEIVVTGSRLRRSTYTSISPLQVISTDVSREVGLIDATEILQESSSVSGQQIDLTFTGFVLDDGPGATSVNLRGLGAARSLVLINGRRVAPGGVEGAPTNPNLNFIPISLVSHFDVLLDGASSIYGSDAVAGVVNAVLRKDFDGFEVRTATDTPYHDGGDEHNLSLSWGRNWDRGFVGVGVDYYKLNPTTFDEAPWTRGCERHHEITESGAFRSQDVFYSTVYGMDFDDCTIGLLAGRIQIVPGGNHPTFPTNSIYYTSGSSNGGWGSFSESNLDIRRENPLPTLRFGVDGNQDGVTDVNYRDYSFNGRQQYAHLVPKFERGSLLAYGEYTFDGDANFTPYFELLYGTAKTEIVSGESQLFPYVPANNPYNLCNPAAEGGVDCNLAWNALLNNPDVRAKALAGLGCDPAVNCDYRGLRLLPPGGAQIVRPIVSVRGDRNYTQVDVDSYRFVGGFRADIPALNVGSLSNWQVDMSVSWSQSSGAAFRPGIREDRLDLALGWYSPTATPCDNGFGVPLEADAAVGCVPVNMLAPSLYENVIGDFATPEERAYLFDNRDFDTEYTQTIVSAFLSGTVFALPAGEVNAGLGLEYRNDDMNSMPDTVAREGLFFGYFKDGGAVGDKDTKEVYAEVEVPVLGNMSLAEELTVNLSSRWTDDELYGSGTTYSAKIGYRPVSNLLLRGTLGTSFRAPNLREVFLVEQTGFTTAFDPCLVPGGAFGGGQYIPENDRRDPLILQNCRATGVDPTQYPFSDANVYSIEVGASGQTDLKAEESDVYTVGFAWEQPWVNEFDLTVGVTYFEYEIENTIIEPSHQYIINQCYTSTTGVSVFCDLITRSAGSGLPLIDYVDRKFLNRDLERLRGVDVNVAYNQDITVFGRPIELGGELNLNHPKSRTTLFTTAEGNADFDEYAGEWGFPAWRGDLTWRVTWNDWRLTWRTRYVGSVNQDPVAVDGFDDALTGISDTCFGPPHDELCRDYAEADPYLENAFSVTYQGEFWSVGGGVSNVFDEEPPRVDGSEFFTSWNNVPLGFSYDLLGRRFFLNASYRFGGDGN